MRHWGIKPKYLCRKHLLGAHVECHMLEGTMRCGRNIHNFIKFGLIETHNNRLFHEQLAEEMKARGYNHNDKKILSVLSRRGELNIEANVDELKFRCEECKKNFRDLSYKELSWQ